MIKRDELATYLDELLDCANFEDYAPNGIQVEGKAEIRKICTAVTASLEAVTEALDHQADALLVHHGYFWRGENPVLTGMKKERIAKLIKNNLSLYAYHLPLDCHVEFGNNACLARLFGLSQIEKHKVGKTKDLLWTGTFENSMTAKILSTFLHQKLGREPLYIEGSDKPIRQIALCTGAAQDFIEEAYKLGVDAYLSGEISERTYYQAKELGIHYFACGHHATERYGIQALGDHLASEYKLEHSFLDSSNPV
ncbi:MAG: Nif3-like dinuclear metal center hexameric protein [Tatlockia sp.]|nr:Nif3-like dinuclear metal center hexameric protein [Tatlockia sp.]